MNGSYRGLIYSILSMAVIVLGIVFFIKALPFILLTISVIYIVFRVRRWYLNKKYRNAQQSENTEYTTYSKTYSQDSYSNSADTEMNSDSKIIDVDYEEVDKH